MPMESLDYRRQAISDAVEELRGEAQFVLNLISNAPLNASQLQQCATIMDKLTNTVLVPYGNDTHLAAYWDVQFPESAPFDLLGKMAGMAALVAGVKTLCVNLMASGIAVFSPDDMAPLASACQSILDNIPA